jgi:hypothetical protein
MKETRTERFSVNLTPAAMDRLVTYADEHHWSLSTAAAVLIGEGLDRQPAPEAVS